MSTLPGPDQVPPELLELPQWVAWRYETLHGRPTKVPIDPRTGVNASSTEPSTWGTFDEARTAVQGFSVQPPKGVAPRPCDGVGFVVTEDDDIVGIDLDKCVNEHGEIHADAQRLLALFNSYTEYSPSGRGLRIFIRAAKATESCRKNRVFGCEQIEIYEHGRYFTFTGRHLTGTPRSVEARQEQLDAVCKQLWPPVAVAPPVLPRAETSFNGDDVELIQLAQGGKNGEKFSRLYAGDASGYGSRSEADLALASMLAFYAGPDAGRVERLMRSSGLVRGKWDRADYLPRTIDKAMEGKNVFYDPRGPRIAVAPSNSGTSDAELARLTFPPTDLGNAERLAHRYSDQLRYCHDLKTWLVWDGACWNKDNRGTPARLAGESARAIHLEAHADPSRDYRETLSKWAVASESSSRIAAAIDLARSRPQLIVTLDQLDQEPWLLNVHNGTVDLRTGGLHPHRRDDLITNLAGTSFDPSAGSPRFDSFLDRVTAGNKDLAAYVQRVFGMCLSADISEQTLVILHGTGANGKSVLVDTMLGIMGTYGGVAAPSLLTASKYREHPTEIADLKGKRLVVGSETESGSELRMEMIKRHTGDQRLKARGMRQDYFEFTRTHKLIMVTNNLPRINEDSVAAWRRIQLTPFDVVIPSAERDKELFIKLKDEWPGILAWAVRGCLGWRDGGLRPPVCVIRSTEDYRGQEDHVNRFIIERCEVSPQAFTPWTVLRQSYLNWCEGVDIVAMTESRLGDALKRKGFPTSTRWSDGRTCKGRMGLAVQ